MEETGTRPNRFENIIDKILIELLGFREWDIILCTKLLVLAMCPKMLDVGPQFSPIEKKP